MISPPLSQSDNSHLAFESVDLTQVTPSFSGDGDAFPTHTPASRTKQLGQVKPALRETTMHSKRGQEVIGSLQGRYTETLQIKFVDERGWLKEHSSN